ncbi:MAG: aconitate hydratase [Acidimicrobiales bacterium]
MPDASRDPQAPALEPADIAIRLYETLPGKLESVHKRLARPLTLAEKILFSHLRDPAADVERGHTYADLDPDRLALQDALAQIVALQFMTAGLDDVLIPTTVHCDHLITARVGAATDLGTARDVNAEVYDFLRSVCDRYGIGFWEPGSGIIHQVVLENYAFPGGMMIGTDSHTPNAGGLGMVAVGVGGGDAIDIMTGLPFNLRWPQLIGVHLTGELSGWTAAKDVILRVAGVLGTSGGTGAIVEYFGPGAESISATGKATICNMGAELGATTSLFGYDANTASYLRGTFRSDIADAADQVSADLRCDPEVESDPGKYFDQVVEIDLSELRPLINGPDTPDLSHRVGEVANWARSNGVPVEISSALVGSCTNSSYEDIARAASIARQASASGLKTRVPFYVTPGSEQIRATIERDGLLSDLVAIGATVLANACGPCIGQWDRAGLVAGTKNTIVTSYNRNFSKRNDGSADTSAFLASPETVVAYALAGTLDFDPATDKLTAPDGSAVALAAPAGSVLPPAGFKQSEISRDGSLDGPVDRGSIEIAVSPTSERLQLLEPFAEWDGNDYLGMPVAVKARGKCTTDHISAAGPWLAYRGHLENISGNLFVGATNAFTGATGEGKDPIDATTKPYPEVAKHLSLKGVKWCVVGDQNYGEGSSRELAAMEPRYRGAVVVFAKSFARIHETNLKKQGILPLVFTEESTYDLIEQDDLINVVGLAGLAPEKLVNCSISKPDGSSVAFSCSHTLSAEQIEWFEKGSALNVIRDGTALAVPSPRSVAR